LGAKCHSAKTASQDGGFGNRIAELKRSTIKIAKHEMSLTDDWPIITGIET
jgi:hypothetical protein